MLTQSEPYQHEESTSKEIGWNVKLRTADDGKRMRDGVLNKETSDEEDVKRCTRGENLWYQRKREENIRELLKSCLMFSFSPLMEHIRSLEVLTVYRLLLLAISSLTVL